MQAERQLRGRQALGSGGGKGEFKRVEVRKGMALDAWMKYANVDACAAARCGVCVCVCVCVRVCVCLSMRTCVYVCTCVHVYKVAGSRVAKAFEQNCVQWEAASMEQV